jgi:hypothetical protein
MSDSMIMGVSMGRSEETQKISSVCLEIVCAKYGQKRIVVRNETVEWVLLLEIELLCATLHSQGVVRRANGVKINGCVPVMHHLPDQWIQSSGNLETRWTCPFTHRLYRTMEWNRIFTSCCKCWFSLSSVIMTSCLSRNYIVGHKSILFMSMSWDDVSGLRPAAGLFISQVIHEYGELRYNDIDWENGWTQRKACVIATLSATNFTWTDPGVNPGLRWETGD